MGTRGWLWAVLAVTVACSGNVDDSNAGAGTGTATGTDTVAGTEARAGADTAAETDAGAGGDTGAGTGADAGMGTDAGADAGTGTVGDAGADAGTEGDAGTEPEPCAGGPLPAPLPGCSPVPPASTGDIHADCVARINQFRWECQCLPPLERWVDGEQCADGNAEYDSTNGVHASFFDFPCGSGARAQNECPGWPSNDHVLNGCLQAMWDEGPEDGNANTVNGHYESMATTTYARVACGFFTTPSGQVWSVQNFD